MAQTQAAAPPASAGDRQGMDIRFVAGEAYEVTVRGHRLVVDQPADAGGQDSAPTPTELFLASLATCVAFYAGRFLTRHGWCRIARCTTPSPARRRSPSTCARQTDCPLISLAAPVRARPSQQRRGPGSLPA